MKTTLKLAALASIAAFAAGCVQTDYNVPSSDAGSNTVLNNTASNTFACTGNAGRADNGDANGSTKAAVSMAASLKRVAMRNGEAFDGSQCGVGSAMSFAATEFTDIAVGGKLGKAWMKNLGFGSNNGGIAQLIGGQWYSHNVATVSGTTDTCGDNARVVTNFGLYVDLDPVNGNFVCYNSGSQDGANESATFGGYGEGWDIAAVALDHDGGANGSFLNIAGWNPDAYAVTGLSTVAFPTEFAEGIQYHGGRTRNQDGMLNLLSGGQAQLSVDGWNATVNAKLDIQTGNIDVTVTELGFDGQNIVLANDAKVTIGSDMKTVMTNWDEFGAGYAEVLRFVADVMPADENGDFTTQIDASTFAQLGLPQSLPTQGVRVNADSMRDIANKMDDAAAGLTLGTDRGQLDSNSFGGFRRLR